MNVLYTVQCIHCVQYSSCNECTVHCVQYIVAVMNVLYSVYTVYSTVAVMNVLYNVHVYTVYSIVAVMNVLYSVQCINCVQYRSCNECTVHCIVYTLCTVGCSYYYVCKAIRGIVCTVQVLYSV